MSEECDPQHPLECATCHCFFTTKGFSTHTRVCVAPAEDILKVRELRRQRALLEAKADVRIMKIDARTRKKEYVTNHLEMAEHLEVLNAQKRCREEKGHGAIGEKGWWRRCGSGSMACRMCGFVTSTKRYPALMEEIDGCEPAPLRGRARARVFSDNSEYEDYDVDFMSGDEEGEEGEDDDDD